LPKGNNTNQYLKPNGKRKSKMELLDDHLEKVRHKDEFFFERKLKEASGKAPVQSINFNHNEDNINGVFEVDYAAISE
jgi:hypothetical protein